MDFTQAAFLLQGSANVWSKKVEYLYQSVLKMHSSLTSQKALIEAGEDGQYFKTRDNSFCQTMLVQGSVPKEKYLTLKRG